MLQFLQSVEHAREDSDLAILDLSRKLDHCISQNKPQKNTVLPLMRINHGKIDFFRDNS